MQQQTWRLRKPCRIGVLVVDKQIGIIAGPKNYLKFKRSSRHFFNFCQLRTSSFSARAELKQPRE
jgi:hypothetical protein